MGDARCEGLGGRVMLDVYSKVCLSVARAGSQLSAVIVPSAFRLYLDTADRKCRNRVSVALYLVKLQMFSIIVH